MAKALKYILLYHCLVVLVINTPASCCWIGNKWQQH